MLIHTHTYINIYRRIYKLKPPCGRFVIWTYKIYSLYHCQSFDKHLPNLYPTFWPILTNLPLSTPECDIFGLNIHEFMKGFYFCYISTNMYAVANDMCILFLFVWVIGWFCLFFVFETGSHRAYYLSSLFIHLYVFITVIKTMVKSNNLSKGEDRKGTESRSL